MKNPPLYAAAAAALLILGLAGAAHTQPAPDNAAPDDSADSPQNPDGTTSEPLEPSMDDLMNILVQPRHTKLYYAGTAKNDWELAASELRDMQTAFDRVVLAFPRYQGNDVAVSISNFIEPKILAVNGAIADGDPKRFASSYKDLTTACNTCHTYMERPYLVIKIPDAKSTAYSDQDFRVAPLK